MSLPTSPQLFGGELRFVNISPEEINPVRPSQAVDEVDRIQVNSLTPTANILNSGAGVTVGYRRQRDEYFILHRLGQSQRHPALPKHEYLIITSTGVTGASAITEVVTPAAEKFARSQGVYGALVILKEVVRDKMKDFITALHVDRKDDPDEEGLSTICFTISTKSSVDTMLTKDDDLQVAIIRRIPANVSLYFSFAYQFE